MKNQQELSNTTQQVSEISGCLVEPEITEDENIKIFGSFHPKAKCGKQAYLYCSQLNCKQDASICHPSCSSCIQRHPKCIQTKICSNFHNKIQEKLIQLSTDDKKILKQIQSKTDKMTDSISDMGDLLKNQFKIFGLNQTDLNFTYQLFQNYDKTQKGAQLIQIIKKSLNSNVKNSTFCGNLLKKLYDTYQDSQKDQFEIFFQNLKSIVKKHKKIVMSYFYDIQQCLFNLHLKKSSTLSIQNYFANSKIIKKTSGIFNPNTVSEQQCLSDAKFQKSSFEKIYSFYNSTDQYLDFQRSKFVEAIQGKHDLLFLIENRYKKNFGFYTPLKFNASYEGWVKDENKQTFLFSLDYDCCVKIIYPAFTLKYSIKQNKIFIGGQPENGQNLKKNSLQILMGQNPSAHINLSGQQLRQQGLFGASTIDFRDLNGYDLRAVIKNQQINKLQIYQLRRFQQKMKM